MTGMARGRAVGHSPSPAGRWRLAAAVMLLFGSDPWAAAADIPLIDFARHAQYRDVKISPGGDYLAANAVIKDKAVLSLIRLSDLKGNNVRADDETEVLDFFWANAHQVVYSVGELTGFVEQPQPTGALFVADVEDRSNRLLYSGEQGDNFAPGELLAKLPDDPEHILIQTDVYTSRPFDGAVAEAYRVDLRNGRKERVAKAPERGLDFLVDHHGVVRIAYGEDAQQHHKIYHRAADQDEWQLVSDHTEDDGAVVPWAFDRTDANVYYSCEGARHRGGICRWNVATHEQTALWSGAESGPLALLLTADERDTFGVVSMPDRPKITFFDKEVPDARILADMYRHFPGQRVSLRSASSDGSKRIVFVESDINPGDFYLYDQNRKSLTKVLSRMPWIRPETLAQMQPVEFSARDGLVLHGYLTRPLGRESAKDLPLVVMVHGGPFGVRDEWGFDEDVQVLASRGYAVLQVNFRGSSSYGYEFAHAGFKEWGGKMQDDVTDATRWAIDQHVADPARICIYGASYGGYAALEGAVKEPDLYRCAIGYVGVYDLRLRYSRGDAQRSKNGQNYLKSRMGDDPAMLQERSPIEHLDRLKAAVMLIVGGADRRVPPVHGENLHKALEQRKIAHEWIYHSTEGHGFFDETHRADMYERVVAFLDRQIGHPPAARQ